MKIYTLKRGNPQPLFKRIPNQVCLSTVLSKRLAIRIFKSSDQISPEFNGSISMEKFSGSIP